MAPVDSGTTGRHGSQGARDVAPTSSPLAVLMAGGSETRQVERSGWYRAVALDFPVLASTVHPMSSGRSVFTTEAEMAPHLRPHIRALTGTPVSWFTEVPAVNGIPDVTLVRFSPGELQRRARDGLTMPDDFTVIRAALGLNDATEGLTVRSLAAETRLSDSVLRRKALPALVDAGWAERDGSTWSMIRRYSDPASLVVTVELKLHDWKKALAQALQARIGADFAWVVLDARTTSAVAGVAHFDRRSVGLAMLDRCALSIVHPPRRADTDPARRAVLAERLLKMRSQGIEVGPERHVFGRILT